MTLCSSAAAPDAADGSSRLRDAAVHGRHHRPGDTEGAPWLEYAAVAQEGIEDARQATGERDDGDMLAAPGRDAQGPDLERVGLGRVATEKGDGGLDEQPARGRDRPW